METRRTDIQIQIVLVTYRAEHRRAGSALDGRLRDRCLTILDGLEREAGPDPRLQVKLASAREEIMGGGSSERHPDTTHHSA